MSDYDQVLALLDQVAELTAERDEARHTAAVHEASATHAVRLPAYRALHARLAHTESVLARVRERLANRYLVGETEWDVCNAILAILDEKETT